MGVPFAKRGEAVDECIEVVRGAYRRLLRFYGEFYDIPK